MKNPGKILTLRVDKIKVIEISPGLHFRLGCTTQNSMPGRDSPPCLLSSVARRRANGNYAETSGNAMTYHILIVNGPNLGALGVRQPEIYGQEGMDAVPRLVHALLGPRADQTRLDFFQSNHEGVLLDRLEQAHHEKQDGIVLNAGAYTHTSLALADCLDWIQAPCVEVHISNVFAREAIRRESLLARHAVGVISGFGILGYALAVQALVHHCDKNRNSQG
jgi:3-dehydroquinate dehydratase-2